MGLPVPERLTWEEIRDKADEFREQYVNPSDTIPVPVLEIVEFDLGIKLELIPNLRRNLDIDGFFMGPDFKVLAVDSDLYQLEHQQSWLRSTFAHELGHMVLHQHIIKNFNFKTVEEWIQLQKDVDEESNGFYENQADEFGGRLLIPHAPLLAEVTSLRPKIELFMEARANLPEPVNSDLTDDDKFPKKSADMHLADALAGTICTRFGVAKVTASNRIIKENIFDEMGIEFD